MELQSLVRDAADSHGAVEVVVLEHAREKFVGNPYRIPACRSIVILDKMLYLVAGKMTPVALGELRLNVAQIIFIFPCRQKRWIEPGIEKFVGRKNRHFFHIERLIFL